MTSPQTKQSFRLLAGLVAFASLMTGCGSLAVQAAPTIEPTPTTPVEVTATAVPADQEHNTFPSFIAPTVDGGQINFGSLEGQDTVLWFWAPW